MREVGAPCGLCGVRPDVACRHRPADGPPRDVQAEPDKAKPISGGGRYRQFPNAQGNNFRGRRDPS
jgi:hypothetical protein